jgi:hypothetical protein
MKTDSNLNRGSVVGIYELSNFVVEWHPTEQLSYSTSLYPEKACFIIKGLIKSFIVLTY